MNNSDAFTRFNLHTFSGLSGRFHDLYLSILKGLDLEEVCPDDVTIFIGIDVLDIHPGRGVEGYYRTTKKLTSRFFRETLNSASN